MESSNVSVLQFLPPLFVVIVLLGAAYFFYTKYVIPAKGLSEMLSKISSTIISMSDGDEAMRRNGVARVFLNTPLEPVWKEFSKTLHTQNFSTNGAHRMKKSRITVPVNYFFSISSVVDRPLAVEYFKHLPGILTGVGIIGTFSGLLFGLSNFDSSSTETMNTSVGLLLSGVRDAFYASAAAITLAMVITHWEKLLYRRCISAYDGLVDALNTLFESGISEEYLAVLVEHSASSSDQAKSLKDELIQAMVPVIKQLEVIQSQQASGIGEALEAALNESNRRLAAQIETALVRQVKTPLEEMGRKMDLNLSQSRSTPQDMALKVIRARKADNTVESGPELL